MKDTGAQALDLPDSMEAPRLARAFVGSWYRDCDLSVDADDLALLTSEVVTNAVKHAAAPRQLVISRPDAEHVLVEVTDCSAPGRSRAAFAHGPTATSSESGRGLALLENLAGRWGHNSTERGQSVWFTLPRPRPATIPS